MFSTGTKARLALSASTLLLLTACGTTYSLPEVKTATVSRASLVFSEAKSEAPRVATSQQSGVSRFARVARRIEPVAKALCEQELAQDSSIDCDVRLEIDTKMPVRNAYFTYTEQGFQGPVIRFTIPMLQDVKSDNEVAFILGHEYGHLIGQHIVKKQQQALVGALVVGALAAYTTAQSPSIGVSYDANAVNHGLELGAAVGQSAFSQTYELESDMLGTRIAYAAGYDPVDGAKFFARSEKVRSNSGQLSFWGTHPANEKRIEIVIATMEEIQAAQALAKKK